MPAASEPLHATSPEPIGPWQGFLEFVPWGCLTLDETFRIRQLNPAAARLLCASRDALIGTSLRSCLSGGIDALCDSLRHGLTGVTRVDACVRDDAHGASRHLELYAQAYEENGHLRFRVAMLDATATHEADVARARTADELRDLYQNAPCGYHSLAADATVVQINDTELRWLGYERGEIVGKRKLTELMDPSSRAEFESAFASLKSSGRLRDLQVDFRRKDGTLLPVLLSATAVKDGHGMFVESRASMFDITRRRHAEREAQHYARRLKGMSKRAIEVQESERRALAQELHDRVGQNLTALNISLNILKGAIASTGTQQVRARLDDSLQLVDRTVEAIRDAMTELRPAVLDDYGLAAVLRWYAEEFGRRTGIAVTVSGKDPAPRLAAAVEMTLFRIAQESLTNVAKHASASRVSMVLEANRRAFELRIQDDGCGFEPASLDAPSDRGGWGLMIMRERAESAGARLRVESAPGHGTSIVVRVESQAP